MEKNKNLLFAILFIVGFMILWEKYVASRYAVPKPAPKTTEATAEPSSVPSKIEPVPATQPVAPLKIAEEKTVLLETNGIQVELSSLGAKVTRWQIGERDEWVDLVVNQEDRTKRFPLESHSALNFSIEKQSDMSVTFVADDPQGYRVRKTLTLNPDNSALHTVALSFQNKTNQSLPIETNLGWGQGLGNGRGSFDELKAEMRAAALAEKVRSWKPGIIFGKTIDKKDTGLFKWVGVDNNHFLAAFLPLDKDITEIYVSANKKQDPELQIPIRLTLAPGQTTDIRYQLYVGPKKYEDLVALSPELAQSVDFGFFGIISKGLFKGLTYFYGLTGNYGWAIAILTIIIQILVFPLTKKSLQHSVKMRELQPKLKELQAQFKHDPKRMQIETFNLYRKHGMKFMGMEGCFPMLLQIPIFFAFYTTLRVAYELRGASWLWISDLSTFDPIYVLPILMGLGMFLQQKLTAVATDPAQAKMMMFMPIMFTVFFLKLPAGLVLYWVVNSVATVSLQQILKWTQQTTPQAKPS